MENKNALKNEYVQPKIMEVDISNDFSTHIYYHQFVLPYILVLNKSLRN